MCSEHDLMGHIQYTCYGYTPWRHERSRGGNHTTEIRSVLKATEPIYGPTKAGWRRDVSGHEGG